MWRKIIYHDTKRSVLFCFDADRSWPSCYFLRRRTFSSCRPIRKCQATDSFQGNVWFSHEADFRLLALWSRLCCAHCTPKTVQYSLFNCVCGVPLSKMPVLPVQGDIQMKMHFMWEPDISLKGVRSLTLSGKTCAKIGTCICFTSGSQKWWRVIFQECIRSLF